MTFRLTLMGEFLPMSMFLPQPMGWHNRAFVTQLLTNLDPFSSAAAAAAAVAVAIKFQFSRNSVAI